MPPDLESSAKADPIAEELRIDFRIGLAAGLDAIRARNENLWK
jgi:hypothetical protein